MPIIKRKRNVTRYMDRFFSRKLSNFKHSKIDSSEFLSGDIETDDFTAKIGIAFNPQDFRSKPPKVYCHEIWLKNDPDWHYYASNGNIGSFCWILPDEWRLIHRIYKNKSLTRCLSEGCNKLLNNTTWLLDKHWLGHKHGISYWLPEWDEWQHDEKGINEFQAEISAFTIPENWHEKIL